MKEEEIYKKAVEHWGRHLQCWKLFEELVELQKAVIKLALEKDEERKKKRTYSLIGEMVDVEIMLQQLRHVIDFNKDDYNAIKKIKLIKVERMLEKEE